MIQNLFYVLLILAGFPTGLVLTKICKDEIKSWKKRLLISVFLCLVIAVAMSFIDFNFRFPVTISLFFIIIADLTIIWKSY
jgi:hypothetical protein